MSAHKDIVNTDQEAPTRWSDAYELTKHCDDMLRQVASAAVMFSKVDLWPRIDANPNIQITFKDLSIKLIETRDHIELVAKEIPAIDKEVEEDEYAIYLDCFTRLFDIKDVLFDELLPHIAAITEEYSDVIEGDHTHE